MFLSAGVGSCPLAEVRAFVDLIPSWNLPLPRRHPSSSRRKRRRTCCYLDVIHQKLDTTQNSIWSFNRGKRRAARTPLARGLPTTMEDTRLRTNLAHKNRTRVFAKPSANSQICLSNVKFTKMANPFAKPLEECFLPFCQITQMPN